MGAKLGLKLLLGPLRLPGGALRPDGEIPGHLAGVPVPEASGNASGINEEIEFNAPKEGNPVGPLHTGSLASVINSTWRKGVG